MIKKILFAVFVLGLSGGAYAYKMTQNYPYVKTDIRGGGKCYIKAAPARVYGDDGKTSLYDVTAGNDKLIAEYNWFGFGTYLYCNFKCDGNICQHSLVHVKQIDVPDQDVVLEFYLDDKLLKSYTGLEILSDRKKDVAVRDSGVISNVVGYENDRFVIIRSDGKRLEFNPTNGRLVK